MPFTRTEAGPLAHGVPAAIERASWVRFPFHDLPRYDAHRVRDCWHRLHAGRGDLRMPEGALAEGWAHYHNGDFAQAVDVGESAGAEGRLLVMQATAIYANYLEPKEAQRLVLFRQVYERASLAYAADATDVQALYWQSYALGRHSQAVSVARALAQGLGDRVKGALERLVDMQPRHSDAHVALGVFHAEVIDKVGPLVARMTYRVAAEIAIAHFERALALNPRSAHGMMEFGRALVMLKGEAAMQQATDLYRRAAAHEAMDARERLDVELARAGLTD